MNITSCHYLVDVDFPVETPLEPRYSQNSEDWQVVVSSEFLYTARLARYGALSCLNVTELRAKPGFHPNAMHTTHATNLRTYATEGT